MKHKILFVTRFSRIENAQNLIKIYKSILESKIDFVWLIYIDQKIQDKFQNLAELFDKRIKFISGIKKLSNRDVHFTNAIDQAIKTQQANSCDYLFVLDDDNLVHPNFGNVVSKINQEDLVVIRIQNVDKTNRVYQPKQLKVGRCQGYIDWANCIIKIKFLNKIGGIYCDTRMQDGQCVQNIVKNNGVILYTGQFAGYYNKLREVEK